jgi:hypothetical protein
MNNGERTDFAGPKPADFAGSKFVSPFVSIDVLRKTGELAGFGGCRNA